MARLNIDEQFWRDIIKVVAKTGDTDKAIGQAIRFFELAQQKYKQGRNITEEEFKNEGFSEALFGVFAERVEGGIMAIGAEKHFGWLRKRAANGKRGGIASGQARRSDSDDLQRSKRKQTEPSYSYSSSYSSSHSQSSYKNKEEELNTLQPEFAIEDSFPKVEVKPSRPPKAASTTRSNFFLARYCEAWKVRHGSNPDITGKDAGIAGRVCKNMTEERVKTLLRAFFTMPDAYLYQQRHPLELFERDLKKIAAFANSGEFVTRRQTQQNDDMASNMMLLKKVREGEA